MLVLRHLLRHDALHLPLIRHPLRSCTSRLHIATRSYASSPRQSLDQYKHAFSFPAADFQISQLSSNSVGKTVTLHGYLGSRSDVSKTLSFVPLLDRDLQTSVQIVSTAKTEDEAVKAAHDQLKKANEHVPVAVRGTVQSKIKPKEPSRATAIVKNEDVEIKLQELTILNTVPPELDLSESTTLSANNRHLQIRQSKELRDALLFRSKLASICRDYLQRLHSFTEIETPLLFKSTPEGAREFIVPTRNPGFAYALPQSPQQYKQILMGSGFSRYFQLAKCFRDEDLRADRQPEFTQLDMEMSFVTGVEVMECVESLIKHLWKTMLNVDLGSDTFIRMTYDQAMAKFGSDKPDTRLGSEIVRIEHMTPVDLINKIGPLTSPAVEAFVFKAFESPSDARNFVSKFMDSPMAEVFIQNPDGQPGIFIYDSRKPLGGLQPFGFEAAEFIEEQFELEEGDIVILQARQNRPFAGGSTPIGNLRLALHRFAQSTGALEAPTGWNFLWVNDFPLFSPTNETDPGQGGAAGFSSTHHPFTAPKQPEDVEMLTTDPLGVRADHYDLVLNGVELGGGSRRIHIAAVQEFVLRNVLQMSDERVRDFSHLLEVLKAGCPPHAGIALGFDRLCAIMTGKDSIRDVIAFPKSGSGADLLVQSPTRLTASQLETYHLQLKDTQSM